MLEKLILLLLLFLRMARLKKSCKKKNVQCSWKRGWGHSREEKYPKEQDVLTRGAGTRGLGTSIFEEHMLFCAFKRERGRGDV